MDSAHPRAKAAASAWLEIAFWVGQGLAALATGAWLARSSYTLPFYVATVAALIAGLLSLLCSAPPPPKPKALANGSNR
jgi:predicted MFS family arabinose efflux permease